MRSVIRYPGSKARLADWIIGHFPEHRSYLEPFLGSGAVLFQKPRSSIETVNDLDGEVINLFDCIRRDPERLAWEIYNTPYARETYEAADEPVDAYSRAIKLCIRANQGYGFWMVGSAPGWKRDVYGREKAYTARDWCRLPDAVMQAAERLRGVQIECMDAVTLIEQYNHANVLIYCDPPYVLGSRTGKQYKHEMSDKDHERLLQVLLRHTGPVLISGYDNEIYRDMLRGWHLEMQMEYCRANKLRTECLWMNFVPEGQIEMYLSDKK